MNLSNQIKAALASTPAPIVQPRVISPFSLKLPQMIRNETLKADAAMAETDRIINQPIPRVVEAKRANLSRLVDDDFPFDESQRAAIEGLSHEKHGCLTGAAGTGKTTVTKAFTDRIVHDLPSIDMATYFKRTDDSDTGDAEDEYEIPESLIPAIALVAFTGRASQMIKRNFPLDWHGNIMTIHRLLGYYPEYYEDLDEESGQLVKKKRFVPAYHEHNKLPFKIIVVDEAGMLGLELWYELIRACTSDTRIYFIGDINQLPPTHGKSIFGFAMSKWPTWQLTHIHRQKGENNSIVDNAWKVIQGNYPESDNIADPNWKFVMQELSADPNMASKQLRKWLTIVKDSGVYNPIRDTVITPINAFEETAGFALGQDPLNRDLAMTFNSNTNRYVIDAGRDRRYFAVGDKVMATKNDHASGITNGMTGIIQDISINGDYGGNAMRYGLSADVNAYLASGIEADDTEVFSLADLSQLLANEPEKKEKEQRDRGPASHSVTVNFGTEEKPHMKTFRTFAEVGTLMTAYVVTCHKMQGGESPMVIIICHQSHKRMLNREWFYTAITRASQKCVVLYTRMGLSSAINKQTIKGANFEEKIASFQRLIDPSGLFGVTIDVKLPEPKRLEGF